MAQGPDQAQGRIRGWMIPPGAPAMEDADPRTVRSHRKFVYVGFCGTGLSEDTRAVILEELKATHRKTCPFSTVPVLHDDFREMPDTPPQWVRPNIVVEVEYRQRLTGGLRHAALKGLRPDKKPGLIRRSPLSDRGPF